ncbi:MAG: cytochrome b [Betaproteobacteria bacterium]|nr:cytochrome b [Betaproteobacteria bacterium]
MNGASAASAVNGYTRTAVALHWVVALIVFGSFPLGLYMVDLPLSPWKLKLYSWHKWAGVTVFMLALVRLAWRTAHPAPPPAAGVPAWQRRAASATHVLLYLLLLVIPLTGWLMSSAKGFQTVYFGIVPLPDLLPKDKALGDALALVHRSLNYLLATLVVVHMGAALKHHLVDRDETLARMLPFLRKRAESP